MADPSTAIDRTRENYKNSLVPKNGYNSVWRGRRPETNLLTTGLNTILKKVKQIKKKD